MAGPDALKPILSYLPDRSIDSRLRFQKQKTMMMIMMIIIIIIIIITIMMILSIIVMKI